MIYLLLGRPGGGKSYEATVFHVLPALMNGRKVITNLPLNVDAFRAIVPDLDRLLHIRKASLSGDRETRVFASPDDYGDEWRHPETGAGPLYVIDECHKAIPKIGTSRAVEEWYAEHRHETADVLLISQSYGKLNNAIVDMVDVCYQVQKATALGSSDRYVRKVKFGVRGEVVNTAIRKYEPRYFMLYQSHTRGGGAELQAQDIKAIWSHWTFKGAGACVLFSIGWVFWNGFDLFPEPQAVESAPAHVVPEPREIRAAIPQPVSSPDPIPAVHPDKLQQDSQSADAGPFQGLGIHVAGWIQKGARQLYLVALSQNGIVVRMTSSDELVQVGYAVEPVGECAARITYGPASSWIRCDAPTATASPFGGKVGTVEPPKALGDAAGGSPRLRGEAPTT